MEKNNNTKKIIIAVFATILLIGLGAFGMYFYITSIPGTTIINKSEKEVTVNENGIADAVEKVYDSVVVVQVYQNKTMYGTGSGFIYKKEGKKYYVMTNNHVVENATSVKIRLSNDEEIETSLIGSDKYIDIAILTFESDKDYSIAKLGSSENTRVGDTVFTVGAPVDSTTYSWTVTRGILSGKNRMVSVSTSNSNTADYIMESLQTDAVINAGNSGGPLCNSNGEIIGITNMKLVSSSIEGMSFAIPIDKALEYAEKLINGEDVSRPYIGISMAEVTDAALLYYRYNISIPSNVEKGVVIVSVEKGSAAEKAGIKSGDVITKVNGKDVSKIAELKYQLYQYSIGDKVKITYNRDGSEKDTDIILAKSKSE
ncbi:MAG: trypsin-like peptidase domain-containing protein [Bacilli bacterium]|nr:trypsin-like peptidase domain-containing protein [Bacilli bacterium]